MSNSNMQMVYQAFLNAGLSPQQARAITAEVGRENDFQSKYLFGRHVDAANRKVNLGFLSWQGSRGTNLDKRLKSKGLVDGSGNIARNQQALDEMAKFAIEEIRTTPAYSRTKKLFLDNPNVDYQTAQEVLGKNFIRWDYAGKTLGKDVAKHHAKRDKYYAQLGGAAGTAGQESQQPQMPQTPGVPDFYSMYQPSQAPKPFEINIANPQDIFGSMTNQLTANAYQKDGQKIPVLSVDGELVVPENESEFKMFNKVADMNLTPQEESAKAKSIGLISDLKNSMSVKSLFQGTKIQAGLEKLFNSL